MRVPDDIKRTAVAELEATKLLRLDRAYDQIRRVVPHRFRVELIESPDGKPRRLFWPTEHEDPALPLPSRDR